jgi:O-antigen/teichoic acid export membrane protein
MHSPLSLISKLKRIYASRAKNQRIITNVSLSLAIRGGSLVIGLMMLPAYMRYFGEYPALLGTWLTILSVLSWVLVFDLGIGNGLRNHLVAPLIENQTDKIREYISSAYIAIGGVVFVAVTIGYLASSFVNWNLVFNISEDAVSEQVLLTVVLLTFIGIMLRFLLKLIDSIYLAMQKSAIPSALILLSNVLLLLFLLLANTYCEKGDLRVVSWLNLVATNLVLFAATLFIFTTRLRRCAPNSAFFRAKAAMRIMKLGGGFFILQIMYMIITGTNEILISWLVSPEKVVEYSIYNRLFGIPIMVFLLVLSPVWSEVTEAAARNEYAWIKNTYRVLIGMTCMFFIGELILAFYLQPVVDIWLMDKTISTSTLNAFVFSVFGFACLFNGVISTISNGLGKLRVISIFMSMGAILKIPAAYLFMQLTENWIAVVLANIVAMLPYCTIQAVYLHKHINGKIVELGAATGEEHIAPTEGRTE